jgi:hypothetical protein
MSTYPQQANGSAAVRKPVTIGTLAGMRLRHDSIVMVTAYDYQAPRWPRPQASTWCSSATRVR